MAVVVAPLSLTYPSDRTSWRGHPGDARGGLTWLVVLNCGRCSPLQTRGNKPSPGPPGDGLNRDTSAPQNAQHARSPVPTGRGQWWPGRGGRVLEGSTSDIAVAWSSSSPIVGSQVRVCVVTTFPPTLWPRLLCWMVRWVFLLRKKGVCPGLVIASWVVVTSPLCRECPGHGCLLSAKPVPHWLLLCGVMGGRGRPAGPGWALPGGVCSRHSRH